MGKHFVARYFNGFRVRLPENDLAGVTRYVLHFFCHPTSGDCFRSRVLYFLVFTPEHRGSQDFCLGVGTLTRNYMQ